MAQPSVHTPVNETSATRTYRDGPSSDEQSGRMQAMKEKVSHKYDDIQKYMRETDVKSAAQDLQVVAQRHPMKAAATGVAIGYIIGRLVSRG